MMKRMLCVLAALLVGCATSPVPIDKADAVPAERVYWHKPAPENPAYVTFVRDTGFTGAGAYKHLYIDTEKAASLDIGESVSFALAPGEYVFFSKVTDPFNLNTGVGLDQRLEAGKRYYYRLASGLSSGSQMFRFVP